MTTKQTDPIFAACAKSAPRLDLAFYLLAASRTNPESFGDTTPIVIGRMADVYREITGPKPGSTATQRRRAWQVIGQYKASIPQYWRAEPAGEDVAEPAAWWPTQLDDAAIVRLATSTALLAAMGRRLAVPTLDASIDLAEVEPLIETGQAAGQDDARTEPGPDVEPSSLSVPVSFLAPATSDMDEYSIYGS